MISPDPENDDGFTLVEVLVGLMLTAILVAALATLGSQFRTFLNANDQIERAVELDKVARKIAEVIEQAEALPILRNDSNQDIFLIGKPDSIGFVATLKTGVQTFRFRNVSIHSIDRDQLVMKVGYHRPTTAMEPKAESGNIELMTGNLEVSFRYLESSALTEQSLWTESWNHPAKLPRAVSVFLTENYPDGRSIKVSALADLSVD